MLGYQSFPNEVLKHAVLNTGLSLSSIGYDISGANASGEALLLEKKYLCSDEKKIRGMNSLSRCVALQILQCVGEIFILRICLITMLLVSFAEWRAYYGYCWTLAMTLEADGIDRETAA